MEKYLFKMPQVVGVGQGYKVVEGVTTGQKAIIVFVKRKLPLEQLSKHLLVPTMMNGIVTDVIEVGDLNTTSIVKPLISLQFLRSRLRPAAPGVSISHYLTGAGTFGAIVYDRNNKHPLVLSNNHILANTSFRNNRRAKIGDPILQPGTLDGGRVPNDIIAKLKDFVPLYEYPNVNYVDCAVAEPLNLDLIVPYVIGIGMVSGVTLPQIGMHVKKTGSGTGLTIGQIKGINVSWEVEFHGRKLKYRKQIFTTRMSKPGDSGSLIVDTNNKAVGLEFASYEGGSLLNPIQLVLDLLNVEF